MAVCCGATMTITPEEQLAGVTAELRQAVQQLRRHGKTMKDAIRADHDSRWRWGKTRRSKCPWLLAAWAAVSALRSWQSMKAQYAAGKLLAVEYNDSDLPF